MSKNITFVNALLVFSICFSSILYAQKSADVITSYETYTEAPREVVYAHLNKSTFIEGEMLGFTAYVFDKSTKLPSLMTKNLYCSISNENGEVLKQSLLKVEDGVVSNIFDIDSTMSTGVFTFKAYTNWMRNFDENNHFEQTFKVIDADNLELIKPVKPEDFQIDLQVLGEGGHMVYGLPNTVGIIAKNQYQQGLKNSKGQIVAEDGAVLSEFTLNEFGITKTLFKPESDKRYYVQLEFNGSLIKKEIEHIDYRGMILSLSELQNFVVLKLEADPKFAQQFEGETFKLAAHNGSEMVISEFQLNDNGETTLKFNKENLFTGINIFTVFNNDNSPLLERLFFNHAGIERLELAALGTQNLGDSIKVKLKLNKNINVSSSNISMSILPEDTKSYNPNNSLLSQLYIQPYVNGTIENGAYYFSEDKTAAYHLDLLLLTQGWSSYDWYSIVNYNQVFRYPFERGIDIVATVNGNNPGTYVVYPQNDSKAQFYNLEPADREFTIKNTFPTKDEKFKIGNYAADEFSSKRNNPGLYVQYFPSAFPEFSNSYEVPIETFTSNFLALDELQIPKSWQSDQQLDEVVVEVSKQYLRAEPLQKKSVFSTIDQIPDWAKKGNMRILRYIDAIGIGDNDFRAGERALNENRMTLNSVLSNDINNNGLYKGQLLYLDDVLMLQTDFISMLTLDNVDYIEYRRNDRRGNFLGNSGFIKIYTNDYYKNSRSKNTIRSYTPPLVFTKNKKFYTPKYRLYNSPFYNAYGTLGWKPNLALNEDNTIDLEVLNTTANFKLFIEGVVNNRYISQELTIKN